MLAQLATKLPQALSSLLAMIPDDAAAIKWPILLAAIIGIAVFRFTGNLWVTKFASVAAFLFILL